MGDVAVLLVGPGLELLLAVHEHTAVQAPDFERATRRVGIKIRAHVRDIAGDKLLGAAFESGGDGHRLPQAQARVIELAPGTVRQLRQRDADAEHGGEILVELHLQPDEIRIDVTDLLTVDLDAEVLEFHR